MMKNILASAAVFSSIGPFLCLFCCVLPTATGIIAVLTTFGLTGANAMMLGDLSHALHPWRWHIMGFSVVLISLSWAIWLYTYKKAKNTTSCECHDKPKRPIFLSVATLLLIFNLVVVQFMH